MEWCSSFLQNSVFNGVDSLVDVFTDVSQGFAYLHGTSYKKHVESMDDTSVNMEGSNCTMTLIRPDGTFEFECFEQDIVWGLLTIAIMFLPGLQLYSFLISITTVDENDNGVIDDDEKASGTTKLKFVFASLLFPLTMVCVKIASIFYHTGMIKELSFVLTSSEVELQSLTQLSLQLFVVFKRADRFPTFLQWLQIVSSFVTTSKGKADEFIRGVIGQDDDERFLKKLKTLAKYMPYFTFLTVYRVASFSLILVVFHYYAILLYVFLITTIMVVGGLVAAKRNKERWNNSLFEYWKWEAVRGGWYYPILLAVRSLFTEVHDQQQHNILFQGFWFLVNLFFIAGLNFFVNIGEGTFYNFFDLENVAIIQSKVYFNVVIGTVFFSGGLSFVLFVVQIRPKCEDGYEKH